MSEQVSIKGLQSNRRSDPSLDNLTVPVRVRGTYLLATGAGNADDGGMRVRVDEIVLPQNPADVAEAIELGREYVSQRERVIIEVKLDGRTLGDDELERSFAVSDVTECQLISADPRELVEMSLLDAASAIENNRARQVKAAELLQAGNLDEAMNELADVVDVWNAVCQVAEQGPALAGLDPMGIELKLMGGKQVTLESAVRELSSCLSELKGALGLQDWSAAADLLMADLDERAEQWGEVLEKLAEVVKGGRRS
jgi:hypothetical protein